MTRSKSHTTRRLGTAIAACVACIAATAQMASAASPNKYLFANQFGREGGGAGELFFPPSVAVNNDPASATYEDVYVADKANHRVQVFTSGGQFVTMFGGEVNKNGSDVCTKAEESECQSGIFQNAPGRFGAVESIAVDSTSGDVYVADVVTEEVGGEPAQAERVQKFSATGQFLLEIGKDVNGTTNGNVCAAGEACKGAALQTSSEAEADTEAGAFDFVREAGNIVTIGGPSDLLYVGDRGRVQEFNAATGAPAGKILLLSLSASGSATGVAVDSTGDIFVSDSEASGVYKFNSSGVQTLAFDQTGVNIRGIVTDPYGHVAIIEEHSNRHGVLYSTSGIEVNEFARVGESIPGEPKGLTVASSGKMYVANTGGQDIEEYAPIVFPETRTCPATEVTGNGARLCGEVNPNGVPATSFFQYGKTTSFEAVTANAFEGEGETFAPYTSLVAALVPNQEYTYRAVTAAEVSGERLQGHGEDMVFHTAVLSPQIPGSPSASFVTSQSAVLAASVNPEHTATRYHFEYGPCPSVEGCGAVQSTPDETSAVNGAVGASAELNGLGSSTTYSYRLVANNEFEESGKTVGGGAIGAEGTFTTAPAPVPRAETGGVSAVTATSAEISGLVDPDGLPASYAFEIGIYEGAATQYGVVFSGSAGSRAAPVAESFALSGLEPGTTYAYRISISSGYIGNETHKFFGAPAIFTTAGLPTAISLPPILAELPVPKIAFPKATKVSHKKKKVKRSHKHKKPRGKRKRARRK
jgi:hypothetical protein